MDVANKNHHASISQGLESLAYDGAAGCHYDVVIIGSGYGGAIAAASFAGLNNSNGKPLTVAVLERGKEYAPGQFPRKVDEIATHLRVSTVDNQRALGSLEGLFDFRVGADLNVVLANGLGGGSLINAGIMLPAEDHVFAGPRWPAGINAQTMRAAYQQVGEYLGAIDSHGKANTILSHQQGQQLRKLAALEKLSTDQKFSAGTLSTSMQDHVNNAGVAVQACTLCGDCAAGCNYGAKNSLDQNLLNKAYRRGAELFTGATVSDIAQLDSGSWQLQVVFTDGQLRASQQSRLITADKLVIAAGSLGSTELLLKAQTGKRLMLSKQLGKNFSSNGDNIIAHYNQLIETNAVPWEFQAPSQRWVGPTITGVIDDRDTSGIVLEEMSPPSQINRLMAEVYTTLDTIYAFDSIDSSYHRDPADHIDQLGVDLSKFARSSFYAAMGDDGADGELRISEYFDASQDGVLHVHWPKLKHHPLFDQQTELVEKLAENSGLGGRIIANPIWRLLPANLMHLVGNQKGPPTTVHPLGGCAMGDDANRGVVNEYGQVYNLANGNVHELFDNLVVLDGAILPTAVGINPALTIAAVAHRACTALRKHWLLQESSEQQSSRSVEPAAQPSATPANDLLNEHAYSERPSQFRLQERLTGTARLSTAQGSIAVYVEISFASQPIEFPTSAGHHANNKTINAELHRIDQYAQDRYDRPIAKLRIIPLAQLRRVDLRALSGLAREQALDRQAIFNASISGQIRVFTRKHGSAAGRFARAIPSWLFNRGMRDAIQSLLPRDYETRSEFASLQSFLALASTSGSIYNIDYELAISRIHQHDGSIVPRKLAINGKKTISYSLASNPWQQLTELDISDLMGLNERPFRLRLDTRYLFEQQSALYAITAQDNLFRGMQDLGSYFAYALRVLIKTHLWSFRLPDARLPTKDEEPTLDSSISINRLARQEPGIPAPQIFWIDLDNTLNAKQRYDLKIDDTDTNSKAVAMTEASAKAKVVARLCLYQSNSSQQSQPRKLPLLMLHGYSASSTTFSHPALKNSVTRYFYERGHDVWLLDARTSPGLDTARYPWQFEDVAFGDLPLAVDKIQDFYGTPTPLHLLGHCMGGAMISMALSQPERSPIDGIYQRNIASVIFSQFSPTPVFSADNTLKAMFVSAIRPLLNGAYEFRGEANPTLSDMILDRVLSSLPYPESDFRIHNPLNPFRRTTFVRSKQRADALYGRVLNASEMSQRALKHFDDFLGPMNLQTATQPLHFARHSRVSDQRGHNRYIDPVRLRKHWHYPTLSLHSPANGLVDADSGPRAEALFRAAGVDYRSEILPRQSLGHQDALIGKHAARVAFPVIEDFIQSLVKEPPRIGAKPNIHWQLQAPVAGPVMIYSEDGQQLRIGYGAAEQLGNTALPLLLPTVLCEPASATRMGADRHKRLLAQAIEYSLEHVSLWVDREISPSWNVIAIACDALETLQQLANDDAAIEDAINKDINNKAAAKRGKLQLCLLADSAGLIECMAAATTPSITPSVTLPATPRTTATADDTFAPISLHNSETTDLIDTAQSIPTLIDCVRRAVLSSNSSNSSEIGSTIELQNQQSDQALRFCIGSCHYPAGLFDRQPAEHSYHALANYLDESDKPPAFCLLLGDQIYSDASAGMVDPRNRYDRFVRPHLQWLSMPATRKVFSRLPLFAMLDDHEIIDNWSPSTPDPFDTVNVYEQGLAAFSKFQRGRAWQQGQSLWYTVQTKQANFFIADTRSEREHREAGRIASARPKIMSDDQLTAILQWLLENQARDPKQLQFISSASILLPRHYVAHGSAATNSLHSENVIRSDSWDGYPESLQAILAFIAEKRIENVYFLSGDEHLNCYARIALSDPSQPEQQAVIVRSIHCSGLYAPMPFANASVADFVQSKDKDFAANSQQADHTHRAATAQPRSDSFVFHSPASGAELHCEYQYHFDLEQRANIDPDARIDIEMIGRFGAVTVLP